MGVLGGLKFFSVEAGANVEFGTIGAARVIEQAYELRCALGKTILGGVPWKGDNINIYSLPSSLKVGSYGVAWRRCEALYRHSALFVAHKGRQVQVRRLITHEIKLDPINEAIGVVLSGDVGSVLVAMA